MFLTILGILATVVGIFLLGFGVRASQTFTDQVVGGITGHYRRKTLFYIVGGFALIILGILIFYFGWDNQILLMEK